MKTLFWLVLITLIAAGVVVGQDQANRDPVDQDGHELMAEITPEGAAVIPEEVQYSVVDEKEIPEHILSVIHETKAEATTMAFDGDAGTQYVYIALGERLSGGYHISIEAVDRLDDRVVVQYSEIKPGEDEMVIQALTYPWIVLKVHSELPIDFSTGKALSIGV